MPKEKKEKKSKTLESGLEDVQMGDAAASKVGRLEIEATPGIDGFPQKKVKKEKEEIVISLEDLSPIAHPLAERKLTKKIHKTIRRGMDALPAVVMTV
jgi:H/ACA ribonucleoprotein complex subunit 2